MNITIIIPTYNEEQHIKDTICLLEKVIKSISDHSVQILIFDSHSTDQTTTVVRSLQNQFSNILLLEEEQKSGLGSAYVKAMQYVLKHAKTDVIFEFDADGSHQPKYLPLMIEIIAKGADVVVGSRYVQGGAIDAHWGWHRYLISYVGNIVARFFLAWQFRDITSGFRGTKTAFLRQINLTQLLSKNYAYKIHLFWELHRLKANIVETPITFIDRRFGVSKFPRNNMVESLKVVIILRIRVILDTLQGLFKKPNPENSE